MTRCASIHPDNSRYISERGPGLLLQVVHEPPLALGEGPSRQVDVEQHHLGLVKQPLHHKYGTCGPNQQHVKGAEIPPPWTDVLRHLLLFNER